MVSQTRIPLLFFPALARSARTVGLVAVAALVAVVLFVPDALAAQSPVGLGTADSFAVLAGSTVIEHRSVDGQRRSRGQPGPGGDRLSARNRERDDPRGRRRGGTGTV